MEKSFPGTYRSGPGAQDNPMSVFYVQKSVFMVDSKVADSRIFLLRSDSPKRIYSVFGTFPSINAPFSEMTVYEAEFMEPEATRDIWDNAKQAVHEPVHDPDEVEEVRKNDRELERLFMRAVFAELQ